MIRKSYWTELHPVPGFITGSPCTWGTGYLNLQFGGVSNLRQKKVVVSLSSVGHVNDRSGKDQQQL
jgi:hypothetical protein